ncbi:MAG: hypothetical protein C3F12_08680 [Candidatus Methylomirabilota bacterium]|nr:hypothetical protein [candidate division NC10 bacterium]PWB46121.1 MAG: hypothetical protein C3F12_08680 [candidate division NC10 bacterium]
MRITFTMEGGIAYLPGLSHPVVIDSSQLPEQEAGELEQLVEAARFFDQPAIMGSPERGAADYYQYTVTVEINGRRHTVRVTDLVEDAGLQVLLRYLRAKAKALRAAARTRPSPERTDKPDD